MALNPALLGSALQAGASIASFFGSRGSSRERSAADAAWEAAHGFPPPTGNLRRAIQRFGQQRQRAKRRYRAQLRARGWNLRTAAAAGDPVARCFVSFKGAAGQQRQFQAVQAGQRVACPIPAGHTIPVRSTGVASSPQVPLASSSPVGLIAAPRGPQLSRSSIAPFNPQTLALVLQLLRAQGRIR